jgi:MFS family permease
MFDFLDFFLISFVIAFVAKPWHLTFGATTVILLSSGVGAVIGSFLCGASADRVGRRPVLLATIVLFSLGTAALRHGNFGCLGSAEYRDRPALPSPSENSRSAFSCAASRRAPA